MISRRITRREFVLSTMSCGAASLWLATLAASTEAKRRTIKYTDIHTHLGAFYHGKELTVDLLVRFMDAHGVEKSCVLPLISPEAAPIPQLVSTAIAAFERYPDRIIPFCVVDPRAVSEPPRRTGHVAGVKGLIDILKQYQDAGCSGLGEHKTGMLFDSTHNMFLYEACASVGLPVIRLVVRSIRTTGEQRREQLLKPILISLPIDPIQFLTVAAVRFDNVRCTHDGQMTIDCRYAQPQSAA